MISNRRVGIITTSRNPFIHQGFRLYFFAQRTKIVPFYTYFPLKMSAKAHNR